MSKTVYFSNPGHMDLNMVRMMGVNVKVSDTAIGYFGTGLKYGIATLLRTGHAITLKTNGRVHEFSAREKLIRGETFMACYMDDEMLPFTTALGKNWDVWQAYRELHSNTIDEFGTITDRAVGADTVIEVTGDAIYREYLNRGEIFLMGKPIAKTSGLEVHEGPTRAVYYRGVRAGFMPKELRFAYNILQPMTLTEDRTFESQFTVEWVLSKMIPMIEHRGVVSDILSESDGFDQSLQFTNCASPSREFLDVAATFYSDQNSSRSAKTLVERDMQNRGEYKLASLNEAEKQMFLDSFQHLRGLGCQLSPEDVEIVETLGPGIGAIYHRAKNRVFVAHASLDKGMQSLVAILYEEWLHMAFNYVDQTRALQNFLFQRLVALSMGAAPPEPKSQTDGEVLF